MIRINLLTEARAAAAKKKGPALPTGAKLNNLLLIGGLALGLIYIGTMFLVLSSNKRRLDEEDLVVSACHAGQGPSQKRVRPAPMGRAYRVIRRTAHITVRVTERE